MFFIIGVVTVICAIAGGYMMHGGEPALLLQSSELIIILGSGIGAFLISNSTHVIKNSIKSISYLFKRHPYSTAEYTELLVFFFNITKLMRTKGVVAIESHIENPNESNLFKSTPSIMKDQINLKFICDNLRLLVMGLDNVYQLEDVMDSEIDVLAIEAKAPGKALLSLGDSFPALGIVAAVLGVIITMRSIAEPPEVLGGLIASALVGTFLGVLLSYGLILPVGHFVTEYAEERILYLHSIKAGIIGYVKGNPPIIIAEFMRRTIPAQARPSFYDIEYATNNRNKDSA